MPDRLLSRFGIQLPDMRLGTGTVSQLRVYLHNTRFARILFHIRRFQDAHQNQGYPLKTDSQSMYADIIISLQNEADG